MGSALIRWSISKHESVIISLESAYHSLVREDLSVHHWLLYPSLLPCLPLLSVSSIHFLNFSKSLLKFPVMDDKDGLRSLIPWVNWVSLHSPVDHGTPRPRGGRQEVHPVEGPNFCKP